MSAIARFESIPLKRLSVDHRYQRPLDMERVRKIAKNYDPRKLGTLEVARYDGKNSVFDGQHRLAVLKTLKVDVAPCLVHEDLSPAEQAQLFVDLQTQRKRVRPVERFKAKCFSGDKDSRAILRIVEKAGYRVGGDRPNSIAAIVALERIYSKGGVEGLAETLQMLKMWDGDERATDGHIIGGLFWLIHDYGDRLDEQAIAKLAKTSPSVILRRASGGMTVGGGHSASRYVAAELRKVAGLRGRPRGG